MAALLGILGFLLCCFGLIGVIYPRIVRKKAVSRKTFGLVVLAGLVVFFIGVGITPKNHDGNKPVEAVATATEEKQETDKRVFDLREIVLKEQKIVEQFLGAPVAACEKGKHGLSCEYKRGEMAFEVIYIDGLADWISIKDKQFKMFDVPMQLGFDYQKAAFQSRDVIRYDNSYGLRSLSVFLAGSNVDYVYIKAKTE